MKRSVLATALGLMVGHMSPAGVAAQTCTGRSVAVARDDVDRRPHDDHDDLTDDLGDAPASLYARRPQRGRVGR